MTPDDPPPNHPNGPAGGLHTAGIACYPSGMEKSPNHIDNAHHRAATRNIAERVAPILWEIGIRTRQEVRELTDDSWRLALLVAGGIERDNAKQEGRSVDWQPRNGYLPGRDTIELTAAMIDFRARENAAPEVDPFAGLPG